MDENFRFIQVLDELKEKGIITDYVQAANDLGTNKAGISDIKSGRKKLSIELLRRLKLSYPTTNIEWITIVQLKQESAGRVSGAESSTLAGVG